MKIGIPAEMTAGETRIAMIPPRAEQFVERGHEVIVSADGGKSAGWTDEDYRTAGCEVIDTREQVFERSDVLLQVRGLGASDEDGPDQYREGHLVIGLLGPYDLDEELEELAERSITTFALELIPRISRAI